MTGARFVCTHALRTPSEAVAPSASTASMKRRAAAAYVS